MRREIHMKSTYSDTREPVKLGPSGLRRQVGWAELRYTRWTSEEDVLHPHYRRGIKQLDLALLIPSAAAKDFMSRRDAETEA